MQTNIIKLEQLFHKMFQFILSIYFYYDDDNCQSYVMPRYVTMYGIITVYEHLRNNRKL